MRAFGCLLIACGLCAVWLFTQLPHPAGYIEFVHTTASGR